MKCCNITASDLRHRMTILTLSQVSELGDERARYEPRISDDERETLLDGWHRALERSRGWAREG